MSESTQSRASRKRQRFVDVDLMWIPSPVETWFFPVAKNRQLAEPERGRSPEPVRGRSALTGGARHRDRRSLHLGYSSNPATPSPRRCRTACSPRDGRGVPMPPLTLTRAGPQARATAVAVVVGAITVAEGRRSSRWQCARRRRRPRGGSTVTTDRPEDLLLVDLGVRAGDAGDQRGLVEEAVGRVLGHLAAEHDGAALGDRALHVGVDLLALRSLTRGPSSSPGSVGSP